MKNFTFKYHVKQYFGKGCAEEALKSELSGMGNKVMLAYGGGSLKRTGLYDRIKSLLESNGKTVIDFGGIMPNPTYAKVQEGADLVKKEGIDFILAVGGGSVIDCCKIISAQSKTEEDIWDMHYINHRLPADFLPIGAVVTASGTGAEQNNGAVITHEDKKLKQDLLAELNQRIFYLPNRMMINEIDILHERHCGDFACYTSEKTAGLLCVVSYHHKMVIKLREYRFDSFTEFLVCPRRRTPVFLIKPIWNLKGDIGRFKEILLNLSAEISLVSKHHTIMIFPAHVIEIMKVMDTRCSQIIRMYDSAYSTDSMEFIPIVVYALRCTVSPVGSRIGIVSPHGAAIGPCVLAHLHRLGVNTEYILGAINGCGNIFPYLFSKTSCQLTSGIELSATDQVWEILLTLIMQTMKEEILAVESKGFGGNAKSDDFEVGELGDNPTSGYVSESINTISCEILADSEDSDEICYEVAHKQNDGT